MEMLNSRLSLALMILALVSAGLAFMDSRHASASDVHDLTEMIYETRIDDLEYKIEEVERRIARVLLIPEEEQTRYDANELDDLFNQKERYIRKMDRLLGEE